LRSRQALCPELGPRLALGWNSWQVARITAVEDGEKWRADPRHTTIPRTLSLWDLH
jgi:hypothetical protein